MRLFVGLGNPGAKYASNRHNVGFMAVDAIAEHHGFGPERVRFQAQTREGLIEGPGGRAKVLILKPQTFMNESGRAVGEAARFFKLGTDAVTVFYDELDLAPGKVRVKIGGGHAGHNGIRSIAAHLDPGFKRVRIGIGHPGDKARVTGHVLGDFSKAERGEWVEPLVDAMAREAGYLANDQDADFLTKVALRLRPS